MTYNLIISDYREKKILQTISRQEPEMLATAGKFTAYQSQIYLARASFVIKTQSEARLESEMLSPCDGGSSMSSSDT